MSLVPAGLTLGHLSKPVSLLHDKLSSHSTNLAKVLHNLVLAPLYFNRNCLKDDESIIDSPDPPVRYFATSSAISSVACAEVKSGQSSKTGTFPTLSSRPSGRLLIKVSEEKITFFTINVSWC